MAKFRKRIVPAGVYEVPTGTAQPRQEFITPERLSHWAQTGKEMLRRGFRIPAPWQHDAAAVPLRTGVDGTLPSALENAGWWEDFTVEIGQDGVPALYGVVDVPGETNDPQSLASRVGTTVQETSIYVRPNFRDTTGQDWNDALMHIALVTHPVEHNQPNFTLLESGNSLPDAPALALSMSQCRHPFLMATGNYQGAGNAGGSSVSAPASSTSSSALESTLGRESGDTQINSFQELLRRLREIAKIALPDDTSPATLVDRLQVALLQKETSEEEEDETGSVKQPPEGATEQPAPVIMSLSPKQIAGILALKVVNADTGKPFSEDELKAVGQVPATKMSQEALTPELLMAHPKFQEMQQACNFLSARLNEQAATGLKSRIQALITGPHAKVTEAYATQHLLPRLQGFQMSYNQDGTRRESELEVILNALEAAQTVFGPSKLLGTAMNQGLPPGGSLEPLPGHLRETQVSEEEATRLANEFLANTSR